MPQQLPSSRDIRDRVIHTFAIALESYLDLPEDEILAIARHTSQITHIPLASVLDAVCNFERIRRERHDNAK